MRLPRLRRWLSKTLVIFVLLFIYAAWPGSTTFTVSNETTYVTESLDANGYVDYPKALNQRLSQGITPENNANVLIVQALGPKPEGAELSAEYYQWLKIDPPRSEGEYAVSPGQYFQKHLTALPNDIIGLHNESKTLRQWTDTIDRALKNDPRARYANALAMAAALHEGGIPARLTLELTDETPTGRVPVADPAARAVAAPACEGIP